MTAASTNEYVRKLLAKYDIDGYIELFGGPHYTKQVTPKDFDHLIAPFKTTRDVKAIATGIY